ARDEPAVRKVVEAALLAVALAGGIDEREPAGFSLARPGAVEKALLERDGDRLGEADADEAAGGDRVAGPDQARCLASGPDLAVGRGRRVRAQAGAHVSPRSRNAGQHPPRETSVGMWSPSVPPPVDSELLRRRQGSADRLLAFVERGQRQRVAGSSRRLDQLENARQCLLQGGHDGSLDCWHDAAKE